MVLLDTHAMLWALNDDDRLSAAARRAIMRHKRAVSIASLWELAIKASLPKAHKRIDLKRPLSAVVENCDEQGIEILSITAQDCALVMELPHIHEDPFDRMIVAQAMTRGMPLITKDENIAKYDKVETIW